MRVPVFAIALALAGCAGPGQWNHAHGDPAQFRQDAAQCVYESNMATASTPSHYRLDMQISQDITTGMRQGELQRMCMSARGYYWTTQTAAPTPQVSDTLESLDRVRELARAAGCSERPIWPSLTEKTGALESYSVSCMKGPDLSYRCESGRCVAQ